MKPVTENQRIEDASRRRETSRTTAIFLAIGLIAAFLAFFGPAILGIFK
jgi:hypothetical protein